ncbi:MAG: hypothetical protein LZ168_06000 [Thaumarchaeota archaeon]|jgi:hypothetical protein|nr:hypothetical protein [Candidatus Geocrenenecus arthurdayi]
MYEEATRSRARRLGAAALLLYATGTLLIIVGIIVVGSFALSYLSSILALHTAPEATKSIPGLLLVGLGFIFFTYLILYAGFKGYQVVLSPQLSGWDVLVRNLGEVCFAGMLFLTAGVVLTPGAAPLYATVVILFVASALIMGSTLLVPRAHQSVVAGILLVIAATLIIIGERVGLLILLEDFSSILDFIRLGQLPNISRIASVLLIDGLLSAIAFILIGAALIIRGVALHRLTSHTIAAITAAIGGIIYTLGFAYTQLSVAFFLSELLSHVSWLQLLGFLTSIPIEVSGQAETAFWAFYYMSIAGYSIIGIAGILGLIALAFCVVFLVKSIFPSIRVKKRPPPSRS